MKTSQAEKAYKRLVARLSALDAAGESKMERTRLGVYWNTGRAIDRYILKYQKRAPLGKVLLVRLAKDLGWNKSNLYYCLEFARAYPVFHTRGKLTWSHYRALLAINDAGVRNRLTELAIREQWSARTLLEKIRELVPSGEGGQVLACLIPKRGKPGVYRVFEAGGKRYYDLGFRVYYLTQAKMKLVPEESLYTYPAEVLEIIDGDTVWVRIDLGFRCVTFQKLRLRGIDAPELGTQAGKEAKRALEAMLRQGPVMMTTSKSEKDKYDRYLADIYAGDVYVNQKLVDEGFAVIVEE
ncbi:MAG: thermonuclease family protein [Candidatus Omnitrophica bacterium]|nr:thermonuclease family protein [Candidatus Omnitrophota bacterium]